MLIKKLCAAILAFAMAISGNAVVFATASESDESVTVTKDILSGDDIYRFDETALNISGSNLEYSEENNRLFDHNLKMSWGKEGVMFRFFSTTNAAEKFNINEYSYINAWVYNPEIKTDNKDQISNLIWLLRTGQSAADVSGMYYYMYNFPMDWVGWKLVSVPISSFVNGKTGSSLDYGVYCISLEVNGWTHVLPPWTEEGNYAYVDAMWVSKSQPATELSVKNTSYDFGEGYVPVDLGGAHTYTFETTSQLAQSTLTDSVVVMKDKEILDAGYKVEADGTLLNVVFENDLEKGSTYDISLSTGLTDIYGNRLAEEYITSFTVEARSTLFKIMDTSIENGAKDVPLDLGGDRKISIGFNNPTTEEEIIQNMSVLCNGLKVYDGYTAEIEDNYVHITMNSDLEQNAEYTVEFNDRFCDAYGNAIYGDKILSFTTIAASEESGLIWEYVDANSVSTSSNLVHNHENNRRNNDNARMSWGTENVMFSFFYTNKQQEKIFIKDYKYINAWIYNPEVKRDDTNKISNLIWILRTGQTREDVSGMYYYIYNLPMDWVGWKLVSVPIADFANGKEGSSLDYGIYRISLEVNGWTNVIPGWTEEGNYADVDMMWFSKSAPNDFVYVGSSFPEGYDNIPVKDAAIDLTYTNQLSQVSQDAVSLQKDGAEEKINIAVSSEDNRIMVQALQDLEPDTAYTLKVGTDIYDSDGQFPDSGAEYHFTTEKTGLSAGEPVFTVNDAAISELPESGTSIKVTSDVYNYSQSSKNAVLVAAQYDGYGNMIDIVTSSQSFSAGEGKLEVTVERKEKTVALKAFVTKDMTEWNFLRTDYSMIGTEQEVKRKVFANSTVASYGLTIDEAELNISELRVNGKSKGAEFVLMELKDEDDKTVLAVPVYPNTEGLYTYDYTFGADLESGVYTLTSYTKGAKSTEAEILYFDTDDRSAQLNTVNTASDWNTVAQMLKDSKSGFGLDDLSYARINGIAQTLVEQRPYASYSDLLDMISNILATLDSLNSTGWAALGDFIVNNQDLVIYNSSSYSYYLGLSEKNKNKINQTIASSLPVDSFQNFRKVFEAAVTDYKEGLAFGSGGSSGGGGGGGGGGSTGSSGSRGEEMFISPTINPSANTNVNSNNTDNNDDNSEELVFIDLETSLWAKDSILTLYDKKIIAAANDKRFRPEDNITREEFVKLLVCAFEFELIDDESGFSDTVTGAWYEPYLSAAKAKGISVGDAEGNFGIGQAITRQDMAAMLYRAVDSLGKTLNSTVEPQSFIDEEHISDYANEAVKTMQGAGIIHGMDDGSFRPFENCTRAQAAKVIAGLLNTLE